MPFQQGKAFVLVDVRTPAEFAAGHLDGALNIPVEELLDRLHELGPKYRPVAVYCHSGRRSALARSLLVAHGFARVSDRGGIAGAPFKLWK